MTHRSGSAIAGAAQTIFPCLLNLILWAASVNEGEYKESKQTQLQDKH